MKSICMIILLFLGSNLLMADKETLPPLENGKVPKTFEELWRGFDPLKEPLEVEVLHETEKDGIVIKVIRFRVGIFKGKKAMMAGVYGYPKGAKNLPGLLHIHGGGQYAHWQTVFTNAKRGYATFSIAWAGRIDAPGYKVTPAELKAFWSGNKKDPKYKVSTDWGGIDGFHAPCRFKGNNFILNPPSETSVDSLASPRNSGWFYVTMATRRALTFLQKQQEVNPDKLGVYGHSMGAKLTVMTAGSDQRVKAAVPSCGGISDIDNYNTSEDYVTTVCDSVYLPRITCPIVFQIPSNDFHSEINDLQLAINQIKSKEWRVTCSPHMNHMDKGEYVVLNQLWFDEWLKDSSFKVNKTPKSKLILKTDSGIPRFVVKPDQPDKVVALEVYYTEQGRNNDRHNINHTSNKYWRYVPAKKEGDSWTADIPTSSNDKNLWVYANAKYALPKPISGVGYGYAPYTAKDYVISSRLGMATPVQKKAAGVKPTIKPSLVIEDFKDDWQKEWFSMRNTPNQWDLRTKKVYSPLYKAPLGAKLVYEIKSEKPNTLAMNVGATYHIIILKGGNKWEKIEVFPTDFKGQPGNCFTDWQGMKDLAISGLNWKGPRPEFRNLHWVEIPFKEMMKGRKMKLDKVKPVDGKTYLDIEHADVAKGLWKLQMNKWLGSNAPFVYQGKTYKQGISLIAPSEIVYFLGGKYKKFHTVALTGHTPSVELKIYLDRKLVYDSGMINGHTAKTIELPLKDAAELRLEVTNGGNGSKGDSVAWTDIWVE